MSAFRILLLLLVFPTAMLHGQSRIHTDVLMLMGSRFEISAVHEDPDSAWAGIHAATAEIERIEKLISSWDTASQTSAINRNAGIRPVTVDRELYDLIARSLKVSRLTGGAFDISFASMDRIWKFDGSMTQMPDSARVAEAAARIGYQKIRLDPDTHSVFLEEPGMRIGFGAIGKGYAANRARQRMQELGIKAGIVNASGDLTAWGTQPDGSPWKVAIADPRQQKHPLAWLAVDSGAVVTSGDYERYVFFNGIRYAHIIDPRTGYPATGLKSATIICPDTELADALATAVFVLGESEGLFLINRLAGIECLLITDEDKVRVSDKLELQLYGEPEQK